MLVAAREELHGLPVVRRFDAHVADHFRGKFGGTLAIEKPAACIAPEACETHVVAHGHFEDDALRLSILGHEREAGRDGVARGLR